MKDYLVKIRNYIAKLKYRYIWKPIFFRFDPETIHDAMSYFLGFLGKYAITRKFTYFCFGYSNPMLEQNILGIRFKNPIGLSAGFDKDAALIQIMPSLGFGFTEVGSITAKPYGGNQKPRLYRLPEHKTLRVNYGLKNAGAEAIHRKLKGGAWALPVGISIAKTNIPETSEVHKGIEDYFFTYRTFQEASSFFTINISCPNTCEEKPIFAQPENLDALLKQIFSVPKIRPVFIKLSPDLPEAQLNGILEVCKRHPVDGFVCTNLTKVNVFDHAGRGGFSGKAVGEISTKMIQKVYEFYNSPAKGAAGKKIIIGAGGIFNAEDAYRKIKAGASLLEMITGMIYEGPQAVSDIHLGLVKLLKKDGYKNISEAVGRV
jgi:dihydroorotate dehydrogenase